MRRVVCNSCQFYTKKRIISFISSPDSYIFIGLRRAKMKQQQQQQEKKELAEETKVTEVETTKTFEGGFFQVNSPVKPGTINFCLSLI